MITKLLVFDVVPGGEVTPLYHGTDAVFVAIGNVKTRGFIAWREDLCAHLGEILGKSGENKKKAVDYNGFFTICAYLRG
jgi:hypothetical protein